MRLAALPRQGDLLLPLAEPRLVFDARLACAMVAGDTLLECGMVAIRRQDRAAAGVAQQMRALSQPVTDRHTPVKDKAFALPCAVGLRHFLKVFQNTAL